MLADVTAEKAVLGAILSSDVMMAVEGDLVAADFSEPRNQQIYEVCEELSVERHSIDPVIVKARLQERGQLLTAGGFDYLITLANNTPSVDRAIEYATIVNRMATFRAWETAIHQQAQLLYTTKNESLDVVFSKIRAMLDSVEPVSQDEALLMWADSFAMFNENQLARQEEERLIAEGKATTRATIEWRNLKYFGLNRIRPETFGVIAADSSVGKTSFMENIAEHNARQGLQVVFFHLELSHQTMLDRRKVRWSGETMEVVESGAITPSMEEADKALKAWPGAVHYVHCPGWSIRRIVNYVRMMKRKGLCDLAIVDYLQKINLFYRKGGSEEAALADVGEVIKNSAETLEIPYLLGSQMNRASKAEKRRTSIGIRGTGQIEEKSNLVITLNRDILEADYKWGGKVVANEGERSPVADIRVDKNSFGPTGDTKLWMDAAHFRFGDVDVKELDLNEHME
jgi:replicative DNA helicase